MTLHQDAWLSDVLGYEALCLKRVSDNQQQSTLSSLLAEKRQHSSQFFVYTKIAPENLDDIHVVEQQGFRLMDTNVILMRKVDTGVRDEISMDVTIRHARLEDAEAVKKIAEHAFVFDRFHRDSAFDHHLASSIKKEWVGNFFKGERGDALIVADINGTIAGFNLLLWNSSMQTLTIDLIAVNHHARGKGIGKSLIAFACNDMLQKVGYEPLMYRVGTQIANTPSLRLYQQTGFQVESAQYVFHYHHKV